MLQRGFWHLEQAERAILSPSTWYRRSLNLAPSCGLRPSWRLRAVSCLAGDCRVMAQHSRPARGIPETKKTSRAVFLSHSISPTHSLWLLGAERFTAKEGTTQHVFLEMFRRDMHHCAPKARWECSSKWKCVKRHLIVFNNIKYDTHGVVVEK